MKALAPEFPVRRNPVDFDRTKEEKVKSEDLAPISSKVIGGWLCQ